AHPLWADTPAPLNGVAAIHRLAGSLGCDRVRLVDTFNLSRRMAWVRSRILAGDAFPPITVGGRTSGAGGPVAASADATEAADGLDAEAVRGLDIGAGFRWGRMDWERVDARPLDELGAASGTWLAEDVGSGRLCRLQVQVVGSIKRFKRIEI